MLLENKELGIQAEIEIDSTYLEILGEVEIYANAFGYELSKPLTEKLDTFALKIERFESAKSLAEAICVFESVKVCFCMSKLEEYDYEKVIVSRRAKELVLSKIETGEINEERITNYLETISELITVNEVKYLINDVRISETYINWILATISK